MDAVADVVALDAISFGGAAASRGAASTSIVAACSPFTPVLRFFIRGGLNNQKECIVNAGIAAHRLGLPLVLPHVDLVGHGNEQFEPTDAKYVKPYDDRTRWGHFAHLFNATWVAASLNGSLPLLQRVHQRPAGDSGSSALTFVRLTSVFNVTHGCAGFPRWQDTCEARPKDTRLFNQLVEGWRDEMIEECGRRARSAKGAGRVLGTAQPHATAHRRQAAGAGTIVFDAGRSLCWNAYKSRHATTCVRQHPFCAQMLRALRWNRVITRLQQRVLYGIGQQISSTSGVNRTDTTQADGAIQTGASWVAVHVRAFVCARNNRKPSFAHVVDALARLGVRDGLLYVVSSVPVEQVAAALPQFSVIGKSSFLGTDVRLKYPFEVLAAADYGVAVAAPLYLGEPLGSSFDAFALEERQRRNLTVHDVTGTCGA
jgi:hypothetical protein